jgi:nucleoside-diphosphate-sugar epimerase
MRILLTGGTGFVGRDLTGRLLERGHELIVVTRDKARIQRSFREKIRVIETNICETAPSWDPSAKLNEVDVLIHAAACLDYFGNRKRLHRVNVQGTRNMLGSFVGSPRMKKIIFLSSIEAMGPVAEGDVPADETARCAPISPYGVSKLQAEKSVEQFGESRSIPYVILRLGNVYGPGGSNFVLPIAASLKEGLQSTLRRYLAAYQDRYIHPVFITDASKGIIRAMDSPKAKGIYILAGKEYLRIGELFHRVAGQVNTDFHIQEKVSFSRHSLRLRNGMRRLLNRADLLSYFTAACDARIHRAYSIAKIQRELDFVPEVSMEEGITKTLAWARDAARIGDRN